LADPTAAEVSCGLAARWHRAQLSQCRHGAATPLPDVPIQFFIQP